MRHLSRPKNQEKPVNIELSRCHREIGPERGGRKKKDAETRRWRDTETPHLKLVLKESLASPVSFLLPHFIPHPCFASQLFRLSTISSPTQPPSMTTSGNLHTTSGNRSHCRSGNQVGVSCPCNSNPRSCHLFVRKSVCTRGSVVRHGSNLKKRFFTFAF